MRGRNTLQWDQVAAPNFSTSLEGVRTAGAMLDKAFAAASGTINGVDQDISARVNKSLLAQIAGISEADGAEAEIQQLLAGVDPRRLSAETIMFGANRLNDLLQRDMNRLNLEAGRYKQERAVRDDKLSDATNALRMEYMAARAANDETRAAAALNQLSQFEGMQAGLFSSTLEKGQDIRANEQNIRDSDFRYKEGTYGFGRRVEGDQISDKAASILADIRQKGFLTVDSALQYLGQQKDLDPRVFNEVAGRISPMQFINENELAFGGTGGGGASGGGSFTEGAGPTAVAATLRSGGLSDAVVAGFLGNFEVEGGYGGALGDGGSASGIAQWRLERREAFRNKFGKDPHQATPEQQAQFVLWELQTPEGRKVAGITEKQANAILNAKDPGQAADLIDRYYERSDGKHRSRRVESAQRALALMNGAAQIARTNKVDEIVGDPILDGYLETVRPGESVVKVASGLVGEGGVFAGANQANVEAKIREVQTKANEMARKAGSPKTFSAGQAAFLLENSVSDRGWGDWFSDSTGLGKGSIGGRSINDKVLEDNIGKILNGDVEGAALSRQRAAVVQGESDQLNGAIQRQSMIVQQLRATPGMNPQVIANAEAKLAQLQSMVPGQFAQQYAEGDAKSMKPNMPAPVQLPPRKTAQLPSEWSRNFVETTKKGSTADQVTEFMRMFGR